MRRDLRCRWPRTSAARSPEIHKKYEALFPLLDERLRRLWAATEARALGTGGITVVCKATKLSRTTVRNGIRELDEGIPPEDTERIRRPGAGRKRVEDTNPELVVTMELLIEPLTRGDPESPLRWTCKSLRKLSSELRELGFKVTPGEVGELLRGLGYSLQSNRKTRDGADHPDRNAPVPTHRPQGPRLPSPRAARDLRRHQEEGVDRRLQERRPRVVSEG